MLCCPSSSPVPPLRGARRRTALHRSISGVIGKPCPACLTALQPSCDRFAKEMAKLVRQMLGGTRSTFLAIQSPGTLVQTAHRYRDAYEGVTASCSSADGLQVPIVQPYNSNTCCRVRQLHLLVSVLIVRASALRTSVTFRARSLASQPLLLGGQLGRWPPVDGGKLCPWCWCWLWFGFW